MYPAALVALVLLLLRPAEATANNGLKEEAWKPLCRLSEELDELPNELLDDAQSIFSKALNLKREALRTQIFVTAEPDDPEARALSALAAILGANANNMVQALTNRGISSQIDAAKQVGYIKERVDEWLALASQVKSSAHACLVTTSDNIAPVVQSSTIGGEPCKLQSAKTIAKQRLSKTHVTTAFPNIKHPGMAGSDQQSGAKTCKLFSDRPANGLHAQDAATGVSYIDGAITVETGAGQPAKITDLSDEAKIAAASGDAWKKLNRALKARVKADGADFKNESAEMDTDGITRKILSTANTGRQPRLEAQLSGIRDSLFTATPKDKVHKFMVKVSTYKLKAEIAGKSKDAILGDITDTTDLHSILATMQTAAAVERAELKAQLKAALAIKDALNDDSCKDKGDNQEKCNGEKQCSWYSNMTE
uniref:Variant surface glycoprotein 1125.1306 n=1 Tax=Trypanosoma brucei TaxID=5691 RepID=A0A1J0R6P1_9TRYP|nr:variant surface glycoprotein 1125.1306 [Trypanosoma brucei]